MSATEMSALAPADEPVQVGFDYSQIDESVRDEVREAARKIRAYGESLKGSMIAIGKRLQAIKGMLPHGQFEAWIVGEFNISPRTAQNLMNVAKVYGDGKNEIVSLLPDAVLYALAAPSTPEEVRAEIEQRAADGEVVKVADVREAKHAHVEKDASTLTEPLPEGTRFAPVWELEQAVASWFDNVLQGRGDDVLMNKLSVLQYMRKDPENHPDFLSLRPRLPEYWRKSDLVQAINNVREQRRIAARQAAARTVYVEPEPDTKPTHLFPVPEHARIEIDDAELRQAGFHLVRTIEADGGTYYAFWWKREDGATAGPARARPELAIEDARRAFADEAAAAVAVEAAEEETARQLRQAQTEKRKENKRREATSLPDRVYNVLYADPPWQYSNTGLNGSAEKHYPTMSVDELCALPQTINLQVATNAVLFMWATNPLLEDALQVIRAWGFVYKTNIVWVKSRVGTGFYVRGCHELLLIATRGSFTPLETSHTPPITSVLDAPTQEHSRKPEKAYDLIESLYPGCNYLELFARRTRAGWDSFGNEVDDATER